MSEKNWQNELTAYIDGELSETERREVDVQLARDPKLRALETKLRATVTLMRRLEAPMPSAALKAGVMSQLDDSAVHAKTSWLSLPKLVPLVAFAAAALMVVVLRGKQEGLPAIVVDDQVLLAQNIELVEDLDLLGLGSVDDVDIIEQLKELEVQP
jgi:anti-sigma factor RsiW